MASCLTRAGWGTAAAGWHKRRAWGYEGMVARSQVLGSWATASSCLRDLARQLASQHPGVGEGEGRSLNAAQGGVGGTFGFKLH